jgi:hypothetical protein
MNLQLPCPEVGHRSFEKSLSTITIGDAERPEQLSKFIRPYTCVADRLDIQYAPGELQKTDLVIAQSMFAYPRFIIATFQSNVELFRHSQCRIYQFQTIPQSIKPFVFGLFITDGSHNLIDYCVESANVQKRRAVLTRLMRAVCTPQSVARKLFT